MEHGSSESYWPWTLTTLGSACSMDIGWLATYPSEEKPFLRRHGWGWLRRYSRGLWHFCFGHISGNKIKLMQNKLVEGLDFIQKFLPWRMLIWTNDQNTHRNIIDKRNQNWTQHSFRHSRSTSSHFNCGKPIVHSLQRRSRRVYFTKEKNQALKSF